jgi:hypothetical protein
MDRKFFPLSVFAGKHREEPWLPHIVHSVEPAQAGTKMPPLK